MDHADVRELLRDIRRIADALDRLAPKPRLEGFGSQKVGGQCVRCGQWVPLGVQHVCDHIAGGAGGL